MFCSVQFLIIILYWFHLAICKHIPRIFQAYEIFQFTFVNGGSHVLCFKCELNCGTVGMQYYMMIIIRQSIRIQFNFNADDELIAWFHMNTMFWINIKLIFLKFQNQVMTQFYNSLQMRCTPLSLPSTVCIDLTYFYQFSPHIVPRYCTCSYCTMYLYVCVGVGCGGGYSSLQPLPWNFQSGRKFFRSWNQIPLKSLCILGVSFRPSS